MTTEILVSWDAETGLEFNSLLRVLLAQDGQAGYLNMVVMEDWGQTVFLVWSDDWLSQADAEIAVKNILSPPRTSLD